MRTPAVAAHRGGGGIAPENTFGAFRQAHGLWGDRGVWLELDVHLAARDVPVVIHDAHLDRTTDATGLVCETSTDDLVGSNAAARWPDFGFEPVPELAAILAEGRDEGWRLAIEVKNLPGLPGFEADGSRWAEAVVHSIQDTPFPADDLLVMCFWPPTLERIKSIDPRIRTVVLSTANRPAGGGMTASDAAAYAGGHGHEAIGPAYDTPDLSRDTVDAVHETGLEVFCWTVNEADDITRALSWGLDYVASDRPDRVYEALDAS